MSGNDNNDNALEGLVEQINKRGVAGDEIKELNIFDQIKLVVPLLGKIKTAAIVLFVSLFLSFFLMTISIGIELAIIGELIIFVVLLILIVPFISIKKIPNMYIGVPLVLGERKDGYILKEGWAIIIKGIFEHIPVNIKKINLDFEITVRAEDNAQAILKVSTMIRADKNRICEFLDASGRPEGEEEGDKGIADIIIDMAKSSIISTSKEKTFDKILEIDPEITSNAIKSITSEEGNEIIETIRSDQPLVVPGLGITLTKFVIKEPEPTGKIALVFEKQAVEDLEQKFELTNTETKLLQIKKMMEELKDSGQIIDANSMYLILTEQELLENGHKITPGLNRLLNSLAGLIERGAEISDILGLIKSFKGGK